MDEEVHRLQPGRWEGYQLIVVPSGEVNKQQATVDRIIRQLIELEADRNSLLIGIGGGVTTDITGYVAAVYLRGVDFGFVPTSLLCMVDAAIGGKNGVDVGVYKNLVGTIRQPSFIIYDYSFLSTLPDREWSNGMAEVVKCGCIQDVALIHWLESLTWENLRGDHSVAARLVQHCAGIKARIVRDDEHEKGVRRILNFGHTLGHAIENLNRLDHGAAVAIGMMAACRMSEKLTGFSPADTARVALVLENFKLPTQLDFNMEKALELLKMDKKRQKDELNFILLRSLGQAEIVPVALSELSSYLH